ncbi:MAG: haloacid dehalogenase-like hydrolase, partial [Rickettsiales bacterium]|nr:haloacid dehalogenase-like hydrolase [Rickettsiales bacterium]
MAKKITAETKKTIQKKSSSIDVCKNIYLYDFDGTIVRGDTGVKFFRWWAQKNPLILLWIPYIALCLLADKLKLISRKKMKEEFFRFLPRNKKIADKMIAKFWDHYGIKQLNESVVKMLKDDAKDKDGVIIVISGSP